MGNIEKYNESLSSDERKANARRAGIASGKKRAQRATWKDKLDCILDNPKLRRVLGENNTALMTEMLGEDFTNDDVILLQQAIKAMQGDRLSAEFIGEYSCNKPAERQELEISESKDKFAEVLDMWNKRRDEV